MGFYAAAGWAWTTEDVERIKERDEALTATEKTRHLDEFVCLQKDSGAPLLTIFLN